MLGRGDGGETDGCFGGGDLVGLVKLGCEVAYPLPTIAIGENGFLGFIQQMRKPYGLLYCSSKYLLVLSYVLSLIFSEIVLFFSEKCKFLPIFLLK